ncbi:unnamed protein product [Spirodela intermedia]|uniref:Uncharacterized protein n=2 Tax=Spirodela intermedia TaxID=51605 RepID=A0A7I8KL71_SPIIN|nr:unnamed protein product [Spirodela intermedia]
MTVDERMDPVPKDSAPRDQFPVGMRVLAVDDDPTCLRLLDSLLRRCQYHVTTTNQAITALKLLRENKDKFDLVISDVHMPDMDGFKLLELVGLEMDLPVIMLSANSDTKAVMKGIAHGACDYLLKPVRIEELRNIWQHVIRRKKFDRKDLCDRDNGDAREKPNHVGSDGRQGPGSEASDSNGRFNRKRKDQNEEDDDSEDNGNDNDDPSSQKKPRVVWSVDLHRKFVAAVNELGIDKAVPKRILELMNVERLTRENVASHLQKFRLYLKRIHAVTSQQSNIFAALGGKESYVAMSPIDGMGSFNAAARPRQLPTLTSFQSSGSAGRLNSLSGIGLHGLSSSGMIQLGHSNSIQDVGKIPRTNLPGGIHQGSLLNRMPTAVEVNQFQQLKAANEASNQLLGGYAESTSLGGSSSLFLNPTSGNIILQQQQPGEAGLRPPLRTAALQPNPFPQLPDLGRCSDVWHDTAALSVYSACDLPPGGPLGNRNLSSVRSFKGGSSPMASPGDGTQLDASHCSVAPDRFAMNLTDPDGGSPFLLPTGADEPRGVSSFGYGGSCAQQSLEDLGQGQHEPTLRLDPSLSSTLANHDSLSDRFYGKRVDFGVIDQPILNMPFLSDDQKPAGQFPVRPKDDSPGGPSRLQPLGVDPNPSSYDDLVNAMIKMESEDIILMDGDLSCDIYSLETCM